MLGIDNSINFRKYIWFYVGVVVFVIGFFMISTFFYKPQTYETKSFTKVKDESKTKEIKQDEAPQKFKLLDRGY